MASVVADSADQIRECLVHATVGAMLSSPATSEEDAELSTDGELLRAMLTAAEELTPMVEAMREAARRAKAATHPDVLNARVRWDAVESALRVLGGVHG